MAVQLLCRDSITVTVPKSCLNKCQLWQSHAEEKEALPMEYSSKLVNEFIDCLMLNDIAELTGRLANMSDYFGWVEFRDMLLVKRETYIRNKIQAFYRKYRRTLCHLLVNRADAVIRVKLPLPEVKQDPHLAKVMTQPWTVPMRLHLGPWRNVVNNIGVDGVIRNCIWKDPHFEFELCYQRVNCKEAIVDV